MPPTRSEVIDNLFTTTWRHVKKGIVDQVFKMTPLTAVLLERKNIRTSAAGGRAIDIPIQYAALDDNIKWFGKGDEFGTADPEFLTQLSYTWKFLGDSIVRYWEDEQINKGRTALENYVEAKLTNHRASLRDKLEDAMFTADPSGKGVLSLADLLPIDPTTGTIGTIDRSTYAVLRNQTVNFSGSTIATDLIPKMRKMINDCSQYKAGTRMKPDLIITTQAIYEELEDIVEAMQQIVTAKSIVVDLGFDTITYKGIPIVWCPKCPTGYMYFLNTEHLYLYVDPSAYFDLGPWKEKSRNRDRVAQIFTQMAFCADCFQKQGVIFNIA